MMREIKFRAWDGERMHIWGFLGESTFCGPPSLSNQKGMFELTQMQFTGLTDRHGKEIYEGDIVRDVHGNIGQAKWNHHMWSLYDGDRYWEPTHSDLCEVIGNIYENPEPLEPSPELGEKKGGDLGW